MPINPHGVQSKVNVPEFAGWIQTNWGSLPVMGPDRFWLLTGSTVFFFGSNDPSKEVHSSYVISTYVLVSFKLHLSRSHPSAVFHSQDKSFERNWCEQSMRQLRLQLCKPRGAYVMYITTLMDIWNKNLHSFRRLLGVTNRLSFKIRLHFLLYKEIPNHWIWNNLSSRWLVSAYSAFHSKTSSIIKGIAIWGWGITLILEYLHGIQSYLEGEVI